MTIKAVYRHTQDVSQLLYIRFDDSIPVDSIEWGAEDIRPKARYIEHLFKLILEVRLKLFGFFPRLASLLAYPLQKVVAAHVITEPQVH